MNTPIVASVAFLSSLTVLCLRGAEITVRPGENLHAAQMAARTAAKPVVVTLAGGFYRLSEPLRFGPEDSGVTWRAKSGEKPVLSGAHPITLWRPIGNNVWEARLPETKNGAWSFRRLFVNGVEKERSRHPNTGHIIPKRDQTIPDPARQGKPEEPSQLRDRIHFDPGAVNPNWSDLDEGEFVIYSAWRDSHHPIAEIVASDNLLVLGTPLKQSNWWDWGRGYPYHFENLPDIMDVPGEWCLLRKRGVIRYLAAPGEDPNAAQIIAPLSDQLVVIDAAATNGIWACDITFSGIAFEKTNFWLPREDCSDMQAADHTGAGITLHGARGCRFEDCTFTDFGAYCIDVGEGCRDNAFLRCAFLRAGSGGIRINGATHEDHPFAQTRGTLVEECEVADWGVEFPSACGIIVKHAAGNTIRRCHIHDGSYTGVSLGWVWSYGPSIARDNIVEANHIHHINTNRILSDLGGIYTLGVSPGTILRGNRIHDICRRNYNGNGIYLDEASAHILVENNVVWDIQDSCLHIHFGKELTIRNNVFAQTRSTWSSWAISRGFAEPHMTMYFTGNIIQRFEGAAYATYAPKKWDASSPYTFHINGRTRPATLTANMLTDCNYFAPPKGKPMDKFFGGYNLADWQAGGRDAHSLIGESPFVDAKNGDFTLKPDSPALRVFDPRNVPLKEW